MRFLSPKPKTTVTTDKLAGTRSHQVVQDYTTFEALLFSPDHTAEKVLSLASRPNLSPDQSWEILRESGLYRAISDPELASSVITNLVQSIQLESPQLEYPLAEESLKKVLLNQYIDSPPNNPPVLYAQLCGEQTYSTLLKKGAQQGSDTKAINQTLLALFQAGQSNPRVFLGSLLLLWTRNNELLAPDYRLALLHRIDDNIINPAKQRLHKAQTEE